MWSLSLWVYLLVPWYPGSHNCVTTRFVSPYVAMGRFSVIAFGFLVARATSHDGEYVTEVGGARRASLIAAFDKEFWAILARSFCTESYTGENMMMCAI